MFVLGGVGGGGEQGESSRRFLLLRVYRAGRRFVFVLGGGRGGVSSRRFLLQRAVVVF